MSFYRLARYALFLSLSCLRAADVEISDANLEELIRDALEKPDGALTTADLESLTALSSDGASLLDSQKIKGLGGLEFATGLTSLHLPRHTLSDLGPLVYLTELESLDLAGNDIRDVVAIANLEKLQFVDLSENRINEISPVALLTSIASFDLSDNHLTSMAPLGGYDESVFIDVSRNFLDLDEFLTTWVIDGLKTAGVEVLYSEQHTRTVAIEVDSSHFGDGAGAGTATVESNTYWTASSDSDWLVLSPGAEDGFANDSFPFSLDALPEEVTHRLGYISVGEETVEISQGAEVVVEISDAVLEWHVREALGRHDESITVSHMEQLTNLTVSHSDLFPDTSVADLSGLEYAKNLWFLSVVSSELTSLDPIRGLTSLESLEVKGADLGDAGDLSALTSLESLTLYRCSLTEIPPLPESLGALYLGGNAISDLTPLAGHTQLVTLEVDDNEIVDLEPLGGLTNLKALRLDNNKVREIDALASLASLEHLLVYANHLRSMEELVSLSNLTYVGLHQNYIDFSEGGAEAGYLQEMVDRGVQFPNTAQFSAALVVALDGEPWGPSGGAGEISVASGTYWSASTDADWVTVIDGTDRLGSGALAFEVAPDPDLAESRSATIWVEGVGVAITQYRKIDVPDPVLEATIRAKTGVADRDLLELDLKSLVSLEISAEAGAADSEKLSDLSGLEHAENLETLNLNNTLLTDLHPIRELPVLRVLSVNGAELGVAGDLSGLNVLESLYLYSCYLTEIPPLPESLGALYLSGNAISDLTPLAGQTQLVTLEVDDNEIVDLEPLGGLTNLKALRLDNNKVREIDGLAGLSALEELLIYSNHLRSIEPLVSLPHLAEVDLHHNYIDFSEGGAEVGYLQEMMDRGVQFPNTAQSVATLTAQLDGEPWGPSGGTGEISVASGTYWSASTDADWVTVIDGTDRLGGGALAFEIAPDPDLGASRSATIWIEGVDVAISQYPALSIPDPVLEAAIREALDVPDRDLLAPDLAMLEQLVVEAPFDAAVSDKIADLSGLEHAVNLESISLSGTLVSSLEPIRHLASLRAVYINGSLIEEAAAISDLASLELLTLSNGQMLQVPPVPSSVVSLNLSGNMIADLSPLSGDGQLAGLELADNRIVDLAPLAELSNLRSLSVIDNLVQDASALKGLAKLEQLHISGNHLRSAETFLSLTLLNYLDVRFNYIDISPGAEDAIRLEQLFDGGVEVYYDGQMSPFPYLAINSASVDSGSGNVSVGFESSTYWSASADVPWIEPLYSQGFGSRTLEVLIAANYTNANRVATIAIGGASFAVAQGFEEEYFGYLAAKGLEADQQINWPNADADGDGVSNRREFEMGTNPFDGAWAPVFEIRECDDSTTVLIVGRVEDGISRVVEFSANLVDWIVLEVEPEEADTLMLFRDELTGEERGNPRFYRQRIERELRE